MLKYAIPIFHGKVGGMQFNADFIGDRLCIGKVSHGGTIFGTVIFFPVFHKQAFNIKARLFEQNGGDRRINAPWHSHNDAGLGRLGNIR